MTDKYVAEDADTVVHIDFIVDGELVTPDSVTYTVTDSQGNVVQSLEDVDLEDFTTSAEIALDGNVNTKVLLNEVRYVDVIFIYNDGRYLTQKFYFIRENVRFPLSKDEVRTVLGVTSSEISDEMIDIFSSYQDVKDDLGTDLDGTLEGGGVEVPHIINATKYKAAINVSDTLELLVFRSEAVDNDKYSRFSGADFDAIRGRLTVKYNEFLRSISGDDPTDTTLFIVSNQTDPVTNT